MKKRDFLVPVAVAAGALTVAPAASAIESPEVPSPVGVNQLTPAGSGSRVKVPTSQGRLDSFVLNRQSDGTLIAQHESHISHESHESHASHYSSSY